MGVNNVQNLNKAELYKLAKQKNGQQPKVDSQPWMTPSGSIFKAPSATTTQPADNSKPSFSDWKEDHNGMSKFLDDDKLMELYNKKYGNEKGSTVEQSGTTRSGSATTEDDPMAKYKNVDNASDGKTLAKDAQSETDSLKKDASAVEQDGKISEKTAKNAKKTAKDLEKENKTFQQKLKLEQTKFNQSQQTINDKAAQMETVQNEMDSIQAEIQSLQSSSGGLQSTNTYSLKLAGEMQSQSAGGTSAPSGSSGNESRIASLQSQYSAKGQIMISNGKIIQTMQKTSSKSLKSMNTMTKSLNRNTTKIQKSLNTQQAEQSKVIKVADKIDKIAGTISQVGQALQLGGKALIALGSATSWCGVGGALIAAGTFMQKVGSVAELVGNYGQMAANVTKTAAYAAEGNLAGALQSAGTALQTGAAAVKGTKEFSSNMKAIDQQAEQATQKLAANSAAKDIAKEAKANGTIPDGMSKSAFKKDVKAQILNGDMQGASAKEMKSNILDATAIRDGNDKVVGNTLANNTSAAFAKETRLSTTALKEVKPKWSDKKIAKKAKKYANKQIKQEAKTGIAQASFKATAKEIIKAPVKDGYAIAQTLGQSLSAAGAQLQQQQQITGTGKRVGTSAHRITNPAKTRQVIAGINRRKMSSHAA